MGIIMGSAIAWGSRRRMGGRTDDVQEKPSLWFSSNGGRSDEGTIKSCLGPSPARLDPQREGEGGGRRKKQFGWKTLRFNLSWKEQEEKEKPWGKGKEKRGEGLKQTRCNLFFLSPLVLACAKTKRSLCSYTVHMP